jgi:hypothetical protein
MNPLLFNKLELIQQSDLSHIKQLKGNGDDNDTSSHICNATFSHNQFVSSSSIHPIIFSTARTHVGTTTYNQPGQNGGENPNDFRNYDP